MYSLYTVIVDSLCLVISLVHTFLFIAFLRSRKPVEKNILNRQFLFNFYLKICTMLRVYISTVYTYTFVALGEKSPASLLINYIGVRTSGIIQIASYVLISVSRMVLIVSPVTFHKLNTTLWATMTYISIAMLFTVDLFLQLVVYSPSKCQENLAGIKLHEPFFAYSEIQSVIFVSNGDQSLLTGSELENQTVWTEMESENKSSQTNAENITLFYGSYPSVLEPCRVFPFLSILLSSILVLETIRALSAVIKYTKKKNKHTKLISRALQSFRHLVKPHQVRPILVGTPVQLPIQMSTLKRGRGGSLPNNSILLDGKRIFATAESRHLSLMKKPTSDPRKEANDSIAVYLRQLFSRIVLL